ncbi:serine hydrolase domain-containing protein [Halovulum sp. GXIMD14794]
MTRKHADTCGFTSTSVAAFKTSSFGDEPDGCVGALGQRLQSLLADHPDIPGYAVAVLRDGGIASAAVGSAAPDGRAMTPKTPVRLASITKTFVAAAMLKLWEEGSVDLDAPLLGQVSEPHVRILVGGGYDIGAITIRHLLMHASGMNDHSELDAFLGAVLAEPGRTWTRTDQLELMVRHTDPVGAPGQGFHYSDTGYLLLGEIVERVTGKYLGAAVRELNRFDALELTHLRWEGEPSGGAGQIERAHQYMGGRDTLGIHGSIDAFGGGGLIGHVEDVARYYAALFSGQVFASSETLALMTEAPGHPDRSPYRMGLFVRDLAGHEAYGHGGFWGLEAWAVPALHTVVCAVALERDGLGAVIDLVEGLLNEGYLEGAR